MLFRVLGPVEVEVEGRVLALPRRRERCLLGVLLLDRGRVVSVDRLAQLLWEGDPPERARRIIHGHISRVRGVLEAGGIGQACELVTVGAGYRLDAPPEAVDAHRFTAMVEAANATADVAARARQLRQALNLWRGPVLDQAASDWLRQRLGAALEEQRLAATEALMADNLALGQAHIVLPELAGHAAEHPGREHLIDLYMQALHQVGRKAEALAVFERTRTHLAEQLGIDPGTTLRERHRAILRDQPEPVPDPAPTAAPAPAPSIVPRQLPAMVSDFVGRVEELSVLDKAQDTSAVVISAIDGMAGVGKTALAVRAAHRLADQYPDGQLFVDLYGYTYGMEPVDAAEALDHLLQALGVPGTQIPTDLEQRAALYRSRLAGRRMLILLDNAATEDQILPLLPGSPGCLVLVTSRHRLAGLDHTIALSLETMPTPDAIRLLRDDVGEARLRDQSDAVLQDVIELCGRLPLAIRVAAARLRSHPTWNVQHLVHRLRDQQHRLSELQAGQRSVTAALDLSYQHLAPELQHTYQTLGLHPGPDIDPYATAAMLDTTLQAAQRSLDHLLDAHLLLEPTPGRYRFHDLIRAHAHATATRDLPEPAREAALSRLTAYYRHTALTAANAAYPHGGAQRPQAPPAHPTPDLADPAPALQWLDTELPNLLATAQHTQSEYVLQLSTALHQHMCGRGPHHQAETLHHQALATARALGDQAAEVDALTALGRILRLQARYTLSADYLQQAADLAHTIGYRAGEMGARIDLGHAHRERSRYEQAGDQYRQALQMARTIDDRGGELYALGGLADVHVRLDQYAQAADEYKQLLQIARTIGDRISQLYTLAGVARIHRWEGRLEVAADRYGQALQIARTIGHRGGELAALTGLGDNYRRQRDFAQATHVYGQLLALAQESGLRIYELAAWQGLGRLQHAASDPDAAIAHHERALALATELDQPEDQARAHDGLAHACHATNQHEQARMHWQTALDLLTTLRIDHTDDVEATAAAIRTHLTNLDQRSHTTGHIGSV